MYNWIEKEKRKCKIKNDLNLQWEEVKLRLATGEIQYNDIEKILELNFFERFDNMLTCNINNTTTRLKNISSLMRFVDGDSYDDGTIYDIQRFIPKLEYSSLNRFNPPGEVFIYLGVSLKRDLKKIDNEVDYIMQTCIKEIRALDSKDNNVVSSLKFKYSNSNKNKKLLDLTLADKYKDLDDIVEEIVNLQMTEENDKVGYMYNKINSLCVLLYIKLISDAIFKPILTNDESMKQYEYAPFHAFASYIKYRGYSGIIYKSTMNEGGKNVVLFDIKDVEPDVKYGIDRYKISYEKIEKI